MKQEVDAGELFAELSKSGHVTLYINFETGKSDIKSESQKTIDQILQMLKSHPSLRVSIEGHTDNKAEERRAKNRRVEIVKL